MTSINEDTEDDIDILEEEYPHRYYKTQERLEFVYLEITEYLKAEGIRDLFKKLTLRDVAAMIYDPVDVRSIIKDVPNSLI
jgi:hypothetical protein